MSDLEIIGTFVTGGTSNFQWRKNKSMIILDEQQGGINDNCAGAVKKLIQPNNIDCSTFLLRKTARKETILVKSNKIGRNGKHGTKDMTCI